MRPIPMMLPLIAVLALAGCAATDPYQRAGMWRPNHANETNLAAMAAVPSDLVRGVADDRMSNANDAASAIDRERAGKTYPLPDSAIAKIVPISTGGQSSGGGTP